jgi:hypothetical protein
MVIKKGKFTLKLLSAVFKLTNENALISQEAKEEWMKEQSKWGYPCKDLTKRTEDYLGIKLIGSWTEFQECLMGKAKRKSLKKESNSHSEKGGERFGFDISYLQNSSFGGSKFWLLVVDEATSMVWSYFL